MRMIILWLTASLFTNFAWAQAEEPLQLSLKEAEEYALEHSYEKLNKNIEYQKASQTIRETASRGLPQLSAAIDYQWQPRIPQQPIVQDGQLRVFEFGVEHTNRATLQYNQLLLDASYFVALQATRVYRKTVDLEVESTELDIRTNVAQSYYGVLVSQKSVNILSENLKTLQQQFRETRELYKNGFVEEQDADQLEILVNNMQNNLQNARRQVDLAKQLLKLNLGLPLEREVVLTSTLENLIIPEEMAQDLTEDQFVYSDHIDYRTVLSQEQGAQLQVKNEKATFLPKLNGFVQHQQSNFQSDFEDAFSLNQRWIPSTSVGLSLSWDLLQGLGRFATTEKARLDLEQVQVAKEATKSQLILDYKRAKSDYTYALDNYQNQKRNVELSKKIRDRTRTKYKEGISTSLDLTQVENQYLQNQQNYIQAIQQLLNAKEELEKSLGK